MRLHVRSAAEQAGGESPFTVHTDVFEGPLDLLLYLVKRDGIDLRELSVSQIADAYLAYLEGLQHMDLALAADWLVMAATLVHLKSLELLPRPPTKTDEDEPDPRETLKAQLELYERVKVAAAVLDERPRVGREVFVRDGDVLEPGPRPVRTPLDAFGLLDLYFELLQRRDRPDPVVELKNSGPDVGMCCRRVLDALGGPGSTCDLTELLVRLEGPPERVVTFVGVLEMTRLRWLEVSQQVHLGPVTVEQLRPLEEMDLELVLGEPNLQQPGGEGG